MCVHCGYVRVKQSSKSYVILLPGTKSTMGSISSKAARTLPKEKPSWAGSRTPLKQDSAQETRRSLPSRPLAFENRTDGAYSS